MKNILRFGLILLLLIGCGGGGGSGEDGGNENPEPNPDPGIVLLNPTFDPSLPVRGVGFFPLMHPKVALPGPNGVVPLDAIIEIARESSHPGISFPYQIFGNQVGNYVKFVEAMLAVGKKPTISIYTLSGPSRKPRGNGQWVYFHPEMDAEQLQSAIQYNEKIRQEYLGWLLELKNVVLMYPELKYIIYPELEDNQTDGSFKAMLDINVLVFGDMPNVEIRRNPLGKYGKNSFGLHIEKHGTSIGTLRQLGAGDSLNFDGSDFNFPDQHDSGEPSFDDIKNLMIEGRATGKEVYIWVSTWQGRGKNLAGGNNHPDERTYLVDHVAELKELMILP